MLFLDSTDNFRNNSNNITINFGSGSNNTTIISQSGLAEGFFFQRSYSISFIETIPTLEYSQQAKRLWQVKKKSLQHITNDSSLFRAKLKDVLENYLAVGSSFFSEEELQFSNIFIEDLNSKTLQEFRDKYFNSNSKAFEFNLPFVPDLYDFFINKAALCPYPIDQYMAQEQEGIEERLVQQMEPVAMNRNEFLRFLVYLKAVERQTSGKGEMKAYVVDAKELGPFLEELFKDTPSQPIRLQLLVRTDVHYTAIELEISDEGNYGLILDAALDPSHINIASLMNKFSFTKLYVAGKSKLQQDRFNCATFSLNHLTNTSKIKGLFPFIESLPQEYREKENIYLVDWINFPASMVKAAQSISYLSKHSGWLSKFKGFDSLKDCIMSQSKLREARGVIKPANVLIEKKFKQYVGKACAAFLKMDPETLTAIVAASPEIQFKSDMAKK